MTFDGKLLARAKAALAKKAREHEEELQRRCDIVYKKNPKVQTIDNDIRATMLDAIGVMLQKRGDVESAVSEIGINNLSLQEERRREIAAAGFPEDYLDMGEMCPMCGDTGFIGNTPCSCLMELYMAEQAKELSNMLSVGTETFENFRLDYYKGDEKTHMTVVFELCRAYAKTFGKASDNLFFTGAPGLGKTYLSACIAKVVYENGHSVVYNTAVQVFSSFEKAHFDRDEDAQSEVERLLGCDLLILDDLGTEMTTSFTVSALYQLVNTRLVSGKKTIISTNMPVSDIASRYSAQIASRIAGEYLPVQFFGEDIRILKNKDR